MLKVGGLRTLEKGKASANLGPPKTPFRIRTITLDRRPIADKQMIHLQGLGQLQELRMNQTPISNAGLAHLKDLPRLETIELRETRTTNEGLNSFA